MVVVNLHYFISTWMASIFSIKEDIFVPKTKKARPLKTKNMIIKIRCFFVKSRNIN